MGSVPGSERSSEEGDGKSLQYSCLENPMDRSLVGYSSRGPKESDTVEHTHNTDHYLEINCLYLVIFTESFNLLNYILE